MSSLTQCNHCLLIDLGMEAAREGKFLKVAKSKHIMGGHEVHIVGYGEEPTKDNWRAWCMEIPTSCQC